MDTSLTGEGEVDVEVKKISNFVLQPLGTLIKLSAFSSQLSALSSLRKFWNFESWKDMDHTLDISAHARTSAAFSADSG